MEIRNDLLRPEAFGAWSSRSVQLVQTHISWVFLLDGDVFKIKKPVHFGFLDFRTQEQRRRACEAELELNGRLAPHAYLGVVPVRRGPDGLATLAGEGEIVDWAVHMVRLPDDRRADHMLRRGELSPDDVDRLARQVATFHAGARSDDETARHGRVTAIRNNLEENFRQTQATIETCLSPEDAHSLVTYQRRFLAEHEEWFEARIRASRVRDGHGDLRLEHIYFDRQEATIIDCIEFNERFRVADVCADVAFLAMDLAEHGRVDLAERFLAQYAQASNDYDLYALVDFYESYRAFVRGKVALLTAADEGVDASARQRAKADAHRFFVLALSADRSSLLEPCVVAVGGVIASGKSTIAACIGNDLGAPIVDADRTRKSMLGTPAMQKVHEAAWQGAYDPQFTERVYEEVLRRAEIVLASGRPVVVDASFRSRSMRQGVRDLARRFGVPFRFVECRADAALCRERLERRAREGSVSDGRLEIFDAFVAKFEAVDELPAEQHTVLDTARPTEENMDRVRLAIATWPRGVKQP